MSLVDLGWPWLKVTVKSDSHNFSFEDLIKGAFTILDTLLSGWKKADQEDEMETQSTFWILSLECLIVPSF